MKSTLLYLVLAVSFSFAAPLPAAAVGPEDDPFQARRRLVIEKIGAAIVWVPCKHKEGTKEVDSNEFYYLTGMEATDTVLVLAGHGDPQETLYSAKSAALTSETGNAKLKVLPLEQLRMNLARLLFANKNPAIYLPFNAISGLETQSGGFLLDRVERLVNLKSIVNEMRAIKSAAELESIRKAVVITAAALNETIRAAEPGMREHDLAAILKYEVDRRDAKESFLQAASGPNAVNIHFGATARRMAAGDLIVFDFGAWYNRYTSDISRSVPVSGRFTREQRDIYEIVLQAQKEGMKLMEPGRIMAEAEKRIGDTLIAGLQRIGLVTDAQSPWQRRLFLQHGFGHFIGLDIHDIWNYFLPKTAQETFKPGMVMTIEPGLYFPQGMLDTTPVRIKNLVGDDEFKSFASKVKPLFLKYAGIGVRLEDDILITEKGNEVLSAMVPKEIRAVERLMKRKSGHNLQ